jgi:ethanolamine ammonia-lyase small subunit
MIDERVMAQIVDAVMVALTGDGAQAAVLPVETCDIAVAENAIRDAINVRTPEDLTELVRLKRHTPARVAIGHCGPRMNTMSTLLMRADQAAAFDAVYRDVDPKCLEKLQLFEVDTLCGDKDTFVTRPDLGRKLSPQAKEVIASRCIMKPDVQIYVADGLSSAAVECNAGDILMALTAGLQSKHISVGTPFYLHFGRVGSMDEVSELLGARLTCVLLGERPGLLTAESMSAYIAFGAQVGMRESDRTVVSNIHHGGTAAVEAGAFIADLIEKMLEVGASGVAFREKVGA